MRSISLVAATVLLLVAGFGLYWWFQPPSTPIASTATTQPAAGSAAQLRPRSGRGIVGPGKRPWVRMPDPKTGEIRSQFRAEEYEPQPDDTVRVVRPEAEFYLTRGQLLRIAGETGIVSMPESAGAEAKVGDLRNTGPTQPPSRGELHDVTISLFQSVQGADAGHTPVLTVRLDNLAFDNETFRIYTQGYVQDGKRVEADQVPLTVRGTDYEFDGRGLVIRWNERDERLQLLEIAHGQKLVVKNPRQFSQMTGSRKSAAPPRQAEATSRTTPAPAAARPSTNAAGQTTAKAPRKTATPALADEPAPMYRVTFEKDVRITQGDQVLASGQRMHVDLLLPEGRDDKPVATTSRATAASRPAADADNPPAAAATATTIPDRLADEELSAPVIVEWRGKLTMAPAPAEPGTLIPPTPRDQIVHMLGAPLVLQRQGRRIQCASLVYQTDEGRLLLDGSTAHPLELTDARGAKIRSMSATFSEEDRLATLHGRSHAEFPEHAEPGEPVRLLEADWSRTCDLHFGEDADGAPVIERARIAGDVKLEHPQLRLKSQTVDLTLGPATTRPAAATSIAKNDVLGVDLALQRMVAEGEVSCAISESDRGVRSIACDRLTMDTATDAKGARYPRQITADGSVHAFDAEQELRAGNLVATLRPATRPATAAMQRGELQLGGGELELEELIAHHDVRATSSSGDSASGDQLWITNRDGNPEVRLMGQPALIVTRQRPDPKQEAQPRQAATEQSPLAETRIEGPIIQAMPNLKQAGVLGPGKLHAMWEPSQGGDARPVDIAWSSGMNADIARNLISIDGGVVFTTTDADGATDTARCEQIRLELADSADASSEPPDAEAARQKKDGSALASAGELSSAMRNKVVRKVTLEGRPPAEKVEISSVLAGVDGSLLRRAHLFAPLVEYEIGEGKDKPVRLVIPVPGQLLLEDHRPSQPAEAAEPTAQLAQTRGVTAFEWNKQLVYDQAASQLSMTGQVRIVHDAEKDDAQAFELRAQTVTADVETASDAAARAAAQPQLDMRIRVTGLKAEGGVMFKAESLEFTAPLVTYDQSTHLLTAHSVGGQLVQITKGLNTGAFDQITYDVQKDELHVRGARGAGRQ